MTAAASAGSQVHGATGAAGGGTRSKGATRGAEWRSCTGEPASLPGQGDAPLPATPGPSPGPDPTCTLQCRRCSRTPATFPATLRPKARSCHTLLRRRNTRRPHMWWGGGLPGEGSRWGPTRAVDAAPAGRADAAGAADVAVVLRQQVAAVAADGVVQRRGAADCRTARRHRQAGRPTMHAHGSRGQGLGFMGGVFQRPARGARHSRPRGGGGQGERCAN